MRIFGVADRIRVHGGLHFQANIDRMTNQNHMFEASDEEKRRKFDYPIASHKAYSPSPADMASSRVMARIFVADFVAGFVRTRGRIARIARTSPPPV